MFVKTVYWFLIQEPLMDWSPLLAIPIRYQFGGPSFALKRKPPPLEPGQTVGPEIQMIVFGMLYYLEKKFYSSRKYVYSACQKPSSPRELTQALTCLSSS